MPELQPASSPAPPPRTPRRVLLCLVAAIAAGLGLGIHGAESGCAEVSCPRWTVLDGVVARERVALAEGGVSITTNWHWTLLRSGRRIDVWCDFASAADAPPDDGRVVGRVLSYTPNLACTPNVCTTRTRKCLWKRADIDAAALAAKLGVAGWVVFTAGIVGLVGWLLATRY